MKLVHTHTHYTNTCQSNHSPALVLCDEYKVLFVRCNPLCISYLHVKINQNHVWPISVKTTFPLMNSTIPPYSVSVCRQEFFPLWVYAFIFGRPMCWMIFEQKRERKREIPTRFMHNYSNVTYSHHIYVYDTKCLVFKSTTWWSMQEQTDGLQCQPMCGNVCVIYGQPIYKMCSGKRLVLFIYELIAIISTHTKKANFEFKPFEWECKV